jgi:GTP cyclohydrolase I
MSKVNRNKIIENLKEILLYIGEDPEREGLKDTPERIIRSWEKLFGGYNKNIKDIITTFEDGKCNEMVILKDIEFYSTCEHHFLSFSGYCHVAYIPQLKVIGISKIARIVEMFARRLQIQERLTNQIADCIQKELRARGVMVICEAQHLCMTSRGIEKQNSKMITSAIRGVFKNENSGARNEFMRLLR